MKQEPKIKSSCSFLIKISQFFLISTASVVIADFALSQSNINLPTPREAAIQVEKLRPKEIANIEITSAIRDALRSSADWRPILHDIQQDIMLLKWKYDPIADDLNYRTDYSYRTIIQSLPEPSWEKYGPGIYPLLNYYTSTSDPVRQSYGVTGIMSLGEPYRSIWLRKQISQNSSVSFLNLDDIPGLLESPYLNELIELAQTKISSFPDSNRAERDSSFAYVFLSHLYAEGRVEQALIGNGYFRGDPRISKGQDLPGVRELWTEIMSTIVSDPSKLHDTYKGLSHESRNAFMHHMSRIEANEISDNGKSLFREIASGETTPHSIFSIVELDRHGVPLGQDLLQELLNEKLDKFNLFSSLADSDHRKKKLKVSTYYNLLRIAEKYPNSRYVVGAKKYGDLRGQSYLGREPRSEKEIQRLQKKTLQEQEADWQSWLQDFSDHPGSDEARHFLAEIVLRQNKPFEAIKLWLQLGALEQSEDSSQLMWPYIASILDLGLSIEETELLLEDKNYSNFFPILRYVLSVQLAREHEYKLALEVSKNLDLTKMEEHILFDVYTYDIGNPETSKEAVQRMQKKLITQRLRWEKLSHLKEQDSPDAWYKIASDWAKSGGMKNGHIDIWNGERVSNRYLGKINGCIKVWICDFSHRSLSEIRSSFHKKNSNAVALSIYQRIIRDPNASTQLKEKSLYMTSSILLAQWELGSVEENILIHPLPGFSTSTRKQQAEIFRLAKQKQLTDKQKLSFIDLARIDYEESMKDLLSMLESINPKSNYADDLLFSNYFLTGESKYLQKIINAYPKSDRFNEALFIMEHLE